MFTKKIMAVILSIVMLIGTVAGFASAKEFNDVKEDSWFKEAVDYVVERGLFNGTGKGNFSPNKQASKGMIITVLARMAGTDVDTGATDGNYSDVDYSLWYGPAIAWAYRMGIISDEGKFEPNSMLTRENMAVIIANFIDAFDLTYEEKTSEEPQYTDYDKISEEAKDAVVLTYKAGIFKGNKNGTFKPQSGLTRAELATVIMRLAKLTEESGEVSGIAFDRKTVKVTVNDTVKVAVNAVPKEIENVSYTYTSADTNIATVDEEGNIKGIAVGETTVTVTTVNGLTASCKVIVEEPKPASFSVDSWRLSVWAKQYNTGATAKLKQRYPNRKLEDTLYIVTAVRGYDGGDDFDMIRGRELETEKIPEEYWDDYSRYGYPCFEDKILITDDELNNETPGYDGKYRFTSADESIIKINEYTGRIYMYATSDAYVDENDSCVLSYEKKSTQVTITNIEDGTSITINVALVGKDQYIQSDPN
ncbi:MAG: S-layer homology domain-containing protein, partial [Oscillospiraceae bacterium]|nr:S-layer homology domain-containing protein [Oscillospiraceae bacterium]